MWTVYAGWVGTVCVVTLGATVVCIRGVCDIFVYGCPVPLWWVHVWYVYRVCLSVYFVWNTCSACIVLGSVRGLYDVGSGVCVCVWVYVLYVSCVFCL